MKKKSNKQLAKEILNREIAALKRTTKLLDSKFERACETIISNKGKVITLGIGKSSFIAMKMAATLSSTGTAALFLHPVDALHGDVGVIKKNDVVIIYSNSGETQEVIKLLPLLKLLKCCIISITGNLSVPSTNNITFGSLLTIDTQSSLPTITSGGAGNVLLIDAVPLLLDNTIRFEGSSIDTNDTTLTATDPTADRTITLPDLSGNVVLDTSTGYATSTIFSTTSTLIIYNSSGTPVKTIVGSST